jgi:acyl-coenzyme A synthetase/AMP-(fatty) acid ligase
MELNSHPKVEEGIIVGVEDEEFGQRIAAAVVLKNVCCAVHPLNGARKR